MNRLRWGHVGGSIVFALLLPDSVAAQVVRGQLVESETKSPIPGATIMLLGPDSGTVDTAATDSTAQGFFVAPRFDECAGAPDLAFRPLPATTDETLAERERSLETTLAVMKKAAVV